MSELHEIEPMYPSPIPSPHNQVMKGAVAIDDVRSYFRMIFQHSLAPGMHISETEQDLLAESIEKRLLDVQTDLAAFSMHLITGRWKSWADQDEDDDEEGEKSE